jgi:hypothetical protein
VSEEREFLTVPEWGRLIGVRSSQAYLRAHQLGVLVRIGPRSLRVPRRAVDALGEAAVEHAREHGSQAVRNGPWQE